MGQSTDAQIAYGVIFDEDYEFPWDDVVFQDIEGWWRFIRFFTPVNRIYGITGEWINGRLPTNEEYTKYFTERDEWDKANPLPVKLINYQSADYPAYMLAIPDTYLEANRGYPTAFNPVDLELDALQLQDFLRFLTTYNLEPSAGPNWFLTSYWG